MDCKPLVATLPDQLPDAAHEVALVEDQLKVELAPLATVLGLADRVTVGAGTGELTETLADWVALPPAPEHVSVNVVFDFRVPVDCEPLSDLLPDHPFEAEQAVEFCDDQVSTALLPLVMVLGLAARATVGACGDVLMDTVADCVALPPAPVQVNMYVVVLESAPVDCVPLTPLAPDQPPEAEQEAAFREDHVSVALPPLATALGPTLKVSVGAGDLTDTVAFWVAVPPGPLQVKV